MPHCYAITLKHCDNTWPGMHLCQALLLREQQGLQLIVAARQRTLRI